MICNGELQILMKCHAEFIEYFAQKLQFLVITDNAHASKRENLRDKLTFHVF